MTGDGEIINRVRPTHLDSVRIARWIESGAWTGGNLADRADVIARRHGDATAVVDGSTRLTFADLSRLGTALAASLGALGIGPGSIISFQAPTWWETIVISDAAFRLGAVVNPISPNARAHELDQIFAAARPEVFFLAADVRGRRFEATLDELSWQPPVVVPLRGGGSASAWQELVGSISTAPPAAEIEPTTPALLLFTSGSTSAPKGVVHCHGSLLAEIDGLVAAHGLTTVDRLLVALPVTHIGGVIYTVLAPLYAGIGVALLDSWDAGVALDLIEHEHLTFASGVPTHVDSMVAHPDFAPERVATLRLFALGGTRVTSDDVERTARLFGCVSKRSYGSTETPTLTTGATTDSADAMATSDGRPIGASRVRVVDGAGLDVPWGSMGEIWCEAPEMFVGYLDPSLNRDAFSDDGWFRTGDVGTIDESGALTIRGRSKDVIIRGGENIAPAEVEQLLLRHPAVDEVAIVAMPDPHYGERACAFVVTSDPTFDLAEMVRYLREQRIASFKLPERLEVRSELPITPSGKVRKNVLRDEVANLVARSE